MNRRDEVLSEPLAAGGAMNITYPDGEVERVDGIFLSQRNPEHRDRWDSVFITDPRATAELLIQGAERIERERGTTVRRSW